nr:low-temperature-induced cysteine proteinase-like [Tanacetum cinerariifolium]
MNSEELMGAKWGESGYLKMERNIADKADKCGVAMEASYLPRL